MKLQPDLTPQNAVTGYDAGWIAVNSERHYSSLILSSSGLVQAWPYSDPQALDAHSFALLAQLDIELLLYGSGRRLQFAKPECLAPLYLRGIGVETMDSQAACRTYNILVSEGRRVGAALLLEPFNQP